MKIINLYSAGELVDWDDRRSIAIMRKLGFPLDYLDFLQANGHGEIFLILKLYQPKEFGPKLVRREPSLAFGLSGPLTIGSNDECEIKAVKHEDKILFEIWPYGAAENPSGKVFPNFSGLIDFLVEKNDRTFSRAFYHQKRCPCCALGTPAARTKGLNKRIISAMKSALKASDLEAFDFFDYSFVVSLKSGIAVSVDDEAQIILYYMFTSKAHLVVKILAGLGYEVNDGPDGPDLFLSAVTDADP